MNMQSAQTPATLKKIAVADLRAGMYLSKLCGSWMQHPFWRTSFVLQDAAQIKSLLDSGIEEVWIDTARGLDVLQAPPPAQAAAAVSPPVPVPAPVPAPAAARPVSVTEEMARARKICAAASGEVASMFQEVRMGRAFSSAAAAALVADITDSVRRNPDALISLARLKNADNYTYMHSVAVCGLMVALAGKLGLTEAQTHEAGVAGLMHDLGKALMPMDVLNKPGKLTDNEFRVIQGHPQKGYELLLEGGAAGPMALDVCLHHHEKMDGSGYPHGLKGEAISLYARMGAVCDVYDAITSNRPYKAGWEPTESIQRMTAWSGGHFDKKVFEAFVKSIGIYPTGSLVRLSSGRLAVVTGQGKQSLLKPVVRAFFSTKSKLHIVPEVIDLARAGVTESIVGGEDKDAWGITNLERFWME
ncbi:MAG TPA: HD-GYP domain-containing protein [Burkholderiales bacterium]|jgi:HD-GYP domain-containing protein (c-di-GMP phosphodiesterase class II)|nr:HD-GYP domain-containing protein [Burkholderiales bacterium]